MICGHCRAPSRNLDAVCRSVGAWHRRKMRSQSSSYARACLGLQPGLRRFHDGVSRPLLGFLLSMPLLWQEVVSFLALFALAEKMLVFYFFRLPDLRHDALWRPWELEMQRSVSALIPPLPSRAPPLVWAVNDEHLRLFPDLELNAAGASSYKVPVPDYETMAAARSELEGDLRRRAAATCEQRGPEGEMPSGSRSLPVMGITVANDTPRNRYLRRILHTIDLGVVGSVVVTWYDEQTEAQLVGRDGPSPSHLVVRQALGEYIDRRDFVEIPWNEDEVDDDAGAGTDVQFEPPVDDRTPRLRLADVETLRLLARTASSIHQYCRFAKYARDTRHCENELLVLRFSTNLGCSYGVNNPLFTHPSSHSWLIANHDIAYPPGILANMGRELERSRAAEPDLAVLAFGYIYGRGRLENPWSNFVMTACAVARAGVWSEDIFPAYYEDDDFRDRIRYIMGEWSDAVHGDAEEHPNVPELLMDDTRYIRYVTDRSVAVAHGPISASTYLSGTHEAMQRAFDEEKERTTPRDKKRTWWEWLSGPPPAPAVAGPVPPSSDMYESDRWYFVRQLSDASRYFMCKHGALPDPGEHGEDSLRYFGKNERFLRPFVNRTNMDVLRESTRSNLGDESSASLWSAWSFNATRRTCVHRATNTILSKPKEERKRLTAKYKVLCSVC